MGDVWTVSIDGVIAAGYYVVFRSNQWCRVRQVAIDLIAAGRVVIVQHWPSGTVVPASYY